jgi:hypothetical protein
MFGSVPNHSAPAPGGAATAIRPPDNQRARDAWTMQGFDLANDNEMISALYYISTIQRGAE